MKWYTHSSRWNLASALEAANGGFRFFMRPENSNREHMEN
jgi:hypothetical protein